MEVILYMHYIRFVYLGGLVVSVFATGPKVRGFDPDRGQWIFKGVKNPEHHFGCDCQMALAVTSGSSRKARPVSPSLTAANAQRPRKEEAQAHIGLSSHGYYYIIL
jgi:hypothetical protein